MTIGQSMLPEYDMEMAGTRKVLERVPEDKWEWKIHEKSNTIGWVANHLADIPGWVDTTINRDSLDLDRSDDEGLQFPTESTVAGILRRFDANVSQAHKLLGTVEDTTLHEPWSLREKGQAILTMPRIDVLRSWVLNHTIHHRAHLCVYLRVNDVSVPGLYGPSADDPGM